MSYFSKNVVSNVVKNQKETMAEEMEKKLNNVFSRHPNLNIGSILHNERLGLKPHEKQAVQEQQDAQGNGTEKLAKTLVTKGPHVVKDLYGLANDHSAKGMKDFAADLAKEFNL